MFQEIYNFLALGDDIFTSGMPSAAQLEDAAKAGVQVVINLALPDSERALPNEAAIVESLGMNYIGIPVRWDRPTRQDLDQFMDAMDAHRSARLLVHCQANYRATGFMALYHALRLGWQPDAALRNVRPVWNPDDYPAWRSFLDENLPNHGPG